MPNKNYIKGRRKEYKVCDLLRTEGYQIVQRTAGSHSPIDVIAINKRSREIMLVQCKPDSMSNKQKEQLELEHIELNDEYTVRFEVR